MEGNVEFEDVEFNYPSRVEVPVSSVKGINMYEFNQPICAFTH